MKFIRLAFYEVGTPDGAPAPSGGGRSYLKRHKFNFVKYGPTQEYGMEPVSLEMVSNPDDNTVIGAGVEEVYYDGIEVLNQLPETGFDDPRGA